MGTSETIEWVSGSQRRVDVLSALSQPLTPNQLSKRIGLSRDACSYIAWELVVYGVVRCLNNRAQRCRVYGLTPKGIRCRRKLYPAIKNAHREYMEPDIDWHLYGSVCHRHRAAVMKAFTDIMQPAEVKRAITRRGGMRISGNNVRDVVRYFRSKGLVTPIRVRRRIHLRYRLSESGGIMRELLLRAEATQW